MPYSAYCLFFVPPNKRLDPVLCSIGKWLIGNANHVNRMSREESSSYPGSFWERNFFPSWWKVPATEVGEESEEAKYLIKLIFINILYIKVHSN
jgi:hypothetical protein